MPLWLYFSVMGIFIAIAAAVSGTVGFWGAVTGAVMFYFCFM